MNFLNKIYKFLVRKQKILIVFILIMGGIAYISYENISTGPARQAFNKAFNYYLVGDCQRYSEYYTVSFSDKFTRENGDTEWPSEATYQKLVERSQKCRENQESHNVLDVKIKKISRESFSDTAFVQVELIMLNDNGVHHTLPENFVMKYVNGKWLINIFCDTENDEVCK